jgi:hypothetical protein
VRGSSELTGSGRPPHIIALHVVVLHDYSSSPCCQARTHLGLAASQVPPRPSLPRYCRARPRRPSCESVPSRHASPPPAHVRTARVRGPYRAAALASEIAMHFTAHSGRSPPLESCSCTHTPTPPASVPRLLPRARACLHPCHSTSALCLGVARPAPTVAAAFQLSVRFALRAVHPRALALAQLLGPPATRARTEPPPLHPAMPARVLAPCSSPAPAPPARLPRARSCGRLLRRPCAWAARPLARARPAWPGAARAEPRLRLPLAPPCGLAARAPPETKRLASACYSLCCLVGGEEGEKQEGIEMEKRKGKWN